MKYIAFPLCEDGSLQLTGEGVLLSAEAVLAETIEEMDAKLEGQLKGWAEEDGDEEGWLVAEVVPHSRRTYVVRLTADRKVELLKREE